MSTFEGVHEPLAARDVLLGRTTHVRRIVPNKTRRMIGAWCFLDHYGPDDIKLTGGMWVPPHPHTGLQTVTWLFEGLGLHTDSLGSHQLIRPGQLNVMTAGHGICHAEVSPPEAPAVLHGVQLWVCLPDGVRDSTPPAFAHVADPPTLREGRTTLTVLTGSMAGLTSPAPTHTPLVGAELTLPAGEAAVLPLDPAFEYGVLVAEGTATVDGIRIDRHAMSYLGSGRSHLTVVGAREQSGGRSGERPDERPGGRQDTVVMILGGEPFEEEIVMWWNFVGRSHEEIVEQRDAWNGTGIAHRPERFGVVSDFAGDRLLAPPMPNLRLRPRPRTG